jgi:hypothetical protein
LLFVTYFIFYYFCGYNKNPTARTIKTSIRSNCIFSLCTSTRTNCEATLEDYNPIIIDLIRPRYQVNSNDSSLNSDSDTECISNLSLFSSISSDEDSIKNVNIDNDVTLEDCSVAYFARYLGYKCIKKFNCNFCQQELFTNKNVCDKKQLLLLKIKTTLQ